MGQRRCGAEISGFEVIVGFHLVGMTDLAGAEGSCF
jgi:hypothetical protein